MLHSVLAHLFMHLLYFRTLLILLSTIFLYAMTIIKDEEIIAIYKKKKIHITAPRIRVLKTIYNHREAVFGVSLFSKSGTAINRISVHRTLQLLVKKEILYTVPNTKGKVEYALSSKPQKVNEPASLYKFICKKCGNETFDVHK